MPSSMSAVDSLKASGNAAYARQDYNTAIELYHKALQIDPGNFVLLSNRSAAYMGLEDFELALQDATACVEANPEFVKGYNRQAQAHVMLHQPGLAEAAYRNGLALDSDNPVLRQGLTQLLKEDGDQSKRSHRAGNDQAIRDHMGKVGEDFPDHLANEPNQLLIRALQTASLEALQAIWQPEFNLYRATPNHLAIASLIVSMAQRCSQQAEAMPGYVKILEWVLEQGARVDARDIGGYTALGHAAAHAPVLQLAKVLIDHGSDVNSRNRFGATVLHSAIMASEEEATDMLLGWGADPEVKDNDGVTPKSISRFNPHIMASISTLQGTNKEAEELYSRKCGHCGKEGSERRCSRCRLITYCTPECQKAHWPTHKASCQEQSQQKLYVNICKTPPSAGPGAFASNISRADLLKWNTAKMNGTPASFPTAQSVKGNTHQKSDRLFIVKIQVPQDLGQGLADTGELMCYNQKRNFMCYIPRQQNDSEQLAQLIRQGGLSDGQKAYFRAYVEQATKQLVVVPSMLPAQPW